LPELRTHDVTAPLIDWRAGDAGAVERLISLVHGELRRIAKRHMAGERQHHLLQATALVNEVYLRLIDIRRVQWQDRAHFFCRRGAPDAPGTRRLRASGKEPEARRSSTASRSIKTCQSPATRLTI
jgi:hypothetical protein